MATPEHGQLHNGAGACGLARDGDAPGVATKDVGIVLHPLQGQLHVKEPGVELTLLLDILRRQEAKDTQLARSVSMRPDARGHLAGG